MRRLTHLHAAPFPDASAARWVPALCSSGLASNEGSILSFSVSQHPAGVRPDGARRPGGADGCGPWRQRRLRGPARTATGNSTHDATSRRSRCLRVPSVGVPGHDSSCRVERSRSLNRISNHGQSEPDRKPVVAASRWYSEEPVQRPPDRARPLRRPGEDVDEHRDRARSPDDDQGHRRARRASPRAPSRTRSTAGPGVSEETRDRILAIAEELGWYPNRAARALSASRADACGLILARPASTLALEPFFMEFIAGVEA